MKSLSPDFSKRVVCCLALALLLAGCGTVPPHSGGKQPTEPAQLPHNYVQGLSYMASGDLANAIPVLQRFSADNPQLAGPWLNLGIALRQSGRAEEAMDALSKAVDLNPQNAAAWQELAILHRQQGRFDAALDSYQRALQLDSEYALAHRNVGILYDLYLQQPDLALDHYRKYQALSDAADADVGRWIVDLERRAGDTHARTSK